VHSSPPIRSRATCSWFQEAPPALPLFRDQGRRGCAASRLRPRTAKRPDLRRRPDLDHRSVQVLDARVGRQAEPTSPSTAKVEKIALPSGLVTPTGGEYLSSPSTSRTSRRRMPRPSCSTDACRKLSRRRSARSPRSSGELRPPMMGGCRRPATWPRRGSSRCLPSCVRALATSLGINRGPLRRSSASIRRRERYASVVARRPGPRPTARVRLPSPDERRRAPDALPKSCSRPARLFWRPARLFWRPARLFWRPARLFWRPARLFWRPARLRASRLRCARSHRTARDACEGQCRSCSAASEQHRLAFSEPPNPSRSTSVPSVREGTWDGWDLALAATAA